LRKGAGLLLVGATAIEDKLQDKVPETIASFLAAGIHVWVLTGDKLETAVNIGMACNLLESSMPRKGNLLKLIENNEEDLNKKIEKHSKRVKNNPEGPYGLVMTSDALTIILNSLPKKGEKYDFENQSELLKKFLSVAGACKSVVGCRLTPAQKAAVVSMIKKIIKEVTMAVGDGANDEPMIRAAHVGIGIRGVEGTTAVRAADYVVSQFHFLRKLMFVHGRNNYRRISILICYMFYKTSLMCMTFFWFGNHSGFSGQSLYLEAAFQLWNILFACFPIFVFALFDQDVSTAELLQHPEIYKKTQDKELFSHKEFAKWIFFSLIHSLIIFYFSVTAFDDVTFDSSTGHSSGLWCAGVTIYTSITLVVNLKLALLMASWTWLHYAVLSLTILAYFCSMFILSASSIWSLEGADYYYVMNRLAMTPKYYFTVFLTVVSALFLDYGSLVFDKLEIGQTKQIIEETEDDKKKKKQSQDSLKESKQKLGRSNTGYSFDHTEGEGMRLPDRVRIASVTNFGQTKLIIKETGEDKKNQKQSDDD